MKLVITGATGFVGQNLLPELLKIPGLEILAISRDVSKAKTLFGIKGIIHISIEETDKIKSFKPELVFHLASFLTSSNNTNVIEPLLDANIVYGVKLLDALKDCGSLKLFVNIGTFAEYRMGNSEISNAYLYSATKTAFKQFVSYYSDLCNYKFVHVIPYTIYGGKDTSTKIIDYVIKSMDNEIPEKMTEGMQVLDFIHINDVVSFFKHIIENLGKYLCLKNGEDIHLGTGRGTNIKELVAIMENVYEKKCNIEWGGLPYRERDTMYAVASISKNLILLDWSTKIGLSEGLGILKKNLTNDKE